jgi:hypothetical protein
LQICMLRYICIFLLNETPDTSYEKPGDFERKDLAVEGFGGRGEALA